ncbi:MAG: ATP-dependent helicase, partial [Acidimicrobiales bacterium]
QEWDRSAKAEQRSRALFAQHAIRPDEVAREMTEMRVALGASADVERFLTAAVPGFGGTLSTTRAGALQIDLTETPPALRDAVPAVRLTGRLEPPVADSEALLARTHPLVAGLAAHTLATALDPLTPSPARRCGVVRTGDVTRRTVLLVVRHRFQLVRHGRNVIDTAPLLAEDAAVLAFTGPPTDPVWLPAADAEALLHVTPAGSVHPDQATQQLTPVIAALDALTAHLDADAAARADTLRQAHDRVRDAARAKGVRVSVQPQPPADLLGVYVLLPKVSA